MQYHKQMLYPNYVQQFESNNTKRPDSFNSGFSIIFISKVCSTKWMKFCKGQDSQDNRVIKCYINKYDRHKDIISYQLKVCLINWRMRKQDFEIPFRSGEKDWRLSHVINALQHYSLLYRAGINIFGLHFQNSNFTNLSKNKLKETCLEFKR